MYVVISKGQKNCHEKADKGSHVVVWDLEDYIAEAEKQLSDKNVYRDVNLKAKSCEILPKQVITSLKI